MRSIKFRAWDKKNKKILPIEELDFVLERINKSHNLYPITQDFDEVELMQYTGLKDKNDKEIYEGDIVLVENERKYEMRYLNAAFCLFEQGEYRAIFGKKMSELSKVIGNIYEDEDLLKGGEK